MGAEIETLMEKKGKPPPKRRWREKGWQRLKSIGTKQDLGRKFV